MKKVKRNLKKIFSTFKAIAGGIFGIVAAVALFVTWEDYNLHCASRIAVFIGLVVASLLISVLFVLFVERKAKVWNNGKGTLNVIYGDIIKTAFRGKRKSTSIFVVPVNTSFDTILDSTTTQINPLISPLSIHGEWVLAMQKVGFSRDSIDKMIKDAVRERKLVPQRSFSQKERGNVTCYEKGAVIFVSPLEKVKFLLVALSDFDEKNRGCSSREDLINAIMKVFGAYDEQGQGFEIFIPLMGTGKSRANVTHRDSLNIIKACAELMKDKIQGTVNIVISRDDMDKVSIFD